MITLLSFLHLLTFLVLPAIILIFWIPKTHRLYRYRWWLRGAWLILTIALNSIILNYQAEKVMTIIANQHGKPQSGLEHRIVLLDGHPIDAEIAKTESEKDIGLMYHTSLDAGHGMLFVWKKPSYQHFWMKDTLIPLDILFFNSQGKLIGISPQTPICKKEPCPIYDGNTSKMSQFVLELQSGEAKKLGLKVEQTHMVIQK